jgi:hemerythrin superfamily protein
MWGEARRDANREYWSLHAQIAGTPGGSGRTPRCETPSRWNEGTATQSGRRNERFSVNPGVDRSSATEWRTAMYEKGNRSSDDHSWSEWASGAGEWTEQISMRDALMFGAGAMLMLAAARMAPPFAMRAIGSMRGMAGTDPFDALAQDHQKALAVFDHIEATDSSMVTRRNTLLTQLKRMITAHALAEEDIVYPMLYDDAHRREQALKLYRDHAEVKVKLFELEVKPKNDPSWIQDLRTLRQMFASHAHEEETVEFPRLRAALDSSRRVNLLGKVSREKSLLL